MSNTAYYSLKKADLFKNLATSEKGLSEKEAAEGLKKYGLNKLSEKKKISPLEIYLNQFKSILIIILIIAAIFTFLVYLFGERHRADLIEGSLILTIVFMITVLGFIQEYRAEKAIEALKKLLAFKAKVLRNGEQKEVETINLVPGDVVILEEGEKVPADIRLTEVFQLQINEASLTGESSPVTKIDEEMKDPSDGSLQIADQKNMAFSSTVVTTGRGLGVVVDTGDNTQIGKIASFVSQTQDEQTPIQKRLDKLGRILGVGTIIISVFVFLFIIFFSAEYAHLSTVQKVLQSFVASVALAVAAIPEGLPAVVTISLAFGTQRMLKKNALVRRLTSIETLGSVDTIAADKTGTLTSGEMTVREIHFSGQIYEVTGRGYSTTGSFLVNGKESSTKDLELILKAGLANNNAKLESKDKVLGDPTEAALIVAAHKAGVKQAGKRLFEIPFSSERKLMSVAVEDSGQNLVYSKGAPEVVLSKCRKILQDGQEIDLTEEIKKEVLVENEKMAGKALRVLGFAYKKIDALDKETLEKDLVFLGFQAMIDPPREGVKEQIATCNSSGIRVLMITGDHLATAKAIASEIGINGKALTGAELEKMESDEFDLQVKDVDIYARVNPGHKYKIVEALKKQGHLIAMTGDGVNDAPALKLADIGIAMGIKGTDVSKEASDMILLDDKFGTIISAIEEGRGIFHNIRKFVDYLLSSNIGEVLVVFLALLLFHNIPLTAVMLLWINVVTDGLPAVALGLDPAEKGIMRYRPKAFQEQIINSRVWTEIIFFAVVMTAAILGIFALNLNESGLDEARAAAFMAIIIYELIRLINIRSDYNISLGSNIWLVVAIISSVILQMAIVYIPFLAELFEVTPIDAFDWIYILITSLLLFFLLKLFDRILSLFPYFRNQEKLAKVS